MTHFDFFTGICLSLGWITLETDALLRRNCFHIHKIAASRLKLAHESHAAPCVLLKLATRVVCTVCDVARLLTFLLLIPNKSWGFTEQEGLKMILFRKFRVLILTVFLIACSLHIMIDLLPRLEGKGTGGCSCSHTPSEEPRNWAQPPGRAAAPEPLPLHKHTLRILQDFSNEPGSNVSSHSLEKLNPDAEKTEARRTGEHRAKAGHDRKQETHVAGVRTRSRLAALFEHPLYKRPLPVLTDQDTLFNVNTDIRFDPKAADNQEWLVSSSAFLYKAKRFGKHVLLPQCLIY